MRKSIYFHHKIKKKMKRPEQEIQIGVFKHLTPLMNLQKRKKFIAIHVPNGGGRSAVEAGILRAMGVLAGVMDILIFLPPRFGGIDGRTVFIELKLKTMKLCKRGPLKGQMVAKTTKQSDNQIALADDLRAMKFPVYLVEAKDIGDALRQIVGIIQTEGGFSW